jgi:hypothetical protein
MASYVKFQQFVEDLAHKVHDLETDQIKVALCAAANAPDAAADAVLADLTEISYTYCSSRDITTASSGQSGGTYTLALTDLVLTATGGAVGPLRYVIIYNDTQTSPADPLIGYWDYGSDITLQDTETLTIDFAANSLTIT